MNDSLNSSLKEVKCHKSVILMGYKVESMDIDGTLYFPCKICKRLFKDEKLVIEHLQKCKPRIYLVRQDEIRKNQNFDKPKDPYEIIPEEMDLEDKITHDSTEKYHKTLGNCTKTKYRKYCKNGILSSQDVEYLKYKNSLIKNRSYECSHREKMNKNSKKSNRKKLSDEEIQERLRKISETLKSCINNNNSSMKNEELHTPKDETNQVDNCNETGDEDEFEAIEERLFLLNNGSLNHVENKNSDPKNDIFLCKICRAVFINAVELLQHSRSHTFPKIIMAPSEIEKLMKKRDKSHCPVCQKPLSSSYKSVYAKHLQTHCSGTEYHCSVCNKKFKRKDHMKAHEKRHVIC